MKHIKLFENYNNIDSICNEFGIENYTINPDGSIDVHGNVDLSNRGLTKLPLKFRTVSGNFDCGDNQLISLEGSPKEVGGGFYCNDNQLTTLEGGPKEVSGSFDCQNNQLTTLEGGPKSVGRDFYCENNQLTTLEGSPLSVGGDFICSGNPVYAIWNLFKDYSKIEMFNDYDPIRDDRVIILDRLNSFLSAIGKRTVTEVTRYKCI